MCKTTFSPSCHLPSLMFSTQINLSTVIFWSSLGVHLLANTWAHSRCRYLALQDMTQSVKQEENSFPPFFNMPLHIFQELWNVEERGQPEIPCFTQCLPEAFPWTWDGHRMPFLQRRKWVLFNPKLSTPGCGTPRVDGLRKFKVSPAKWLHRHYSSASPFWHFSARTARSLRPASKSKSDGIQPGETQVWPPAARTMGILHTAFNTMPKLSRDKCLSIFQPITLCFMGITVPCILPQHPSSAFLTAHKAAYIY